MFPRTGEGNPRAFATSSSNLRERYFTRRLTLPLEASSATQANPMIPRIRPVDPERMAQPRALRFLARASQTAAEEARTAQRSPRYQKPGKGRKRARISGSFRCSSFSHLEKGELSSIVLHKACKKGKALTGNR